MKYVSAISAQFTQMHCRVCTRAVTQSSSRLAVIALLCIGLLSSFTQHVHAASSIMTYTSHAGSELQALTPLHPAASQRALVSCSGTNCNGANPYNTGCSSDAYIVPLSPQNGTGSGGDSLYSQGPHSSQGDGLMDLMYSPTCGTNWSYVSNTSNSSNHLEAQVDNLSTNYYYWASCYNCGDVVSLMTYAPTSPAEADGWVLDQYWPNGYRIPCLTQGSNTCWTNLPH